MKSDLLELNRRGLVPGPEESEGSFFARCERSTFSSTPPSALAEQLFDVIPDWVPVQYTKKGLRFWEAACTWIEKDLIHLQLHPSLLKKKRHWGYKHDEIIAHEYVHAVRGTFEEPIFEEILAYSTASSPFRRFWGPLLRTPKESMTAILLLAGCAFSPLYESCAWMVWSSAMALMGWVMIRLIKSQSMFRRTLRKIAKQIGDKKALAVMLRLTDKEIIRFSKMEPAEIKAYGAKMAKIHLRWQQIKAAYF